MAEYTDESWETPESDMEADAFCSVCLIDMNEPGAEKVKSMCKLPVRSRPGSPVNKNALRNAAGRIFQMANVPSTEKKKAARKLVRMMGEAGIEVTSDALKRMADMM